ncbi:MAG: LpqN/LpqT family lipoprotein [Mycolicibacterium sp.]|uniref:LpqN/LpqT family lipoprotein n=1 Tax=Mycolicibacterium sp. TaxID=2320850 RepID=UPI003D102BD1
MVTAALLLTGCSRDVTGTAVSAGQGPGTPGEGQCATVDAPLADIPSVRNNEPRLRIPVPSGWKRNTLMDSPIIRYAIIAEDLTTGGFTPNAVVTLESVPGARDADEVFDENRSNLVAMMGAFDLSTETNTTCGLPSETTDYTAPPMGPAPRRPIIMHAVVSDAGGTTYLATLTIQTADGSNPTYQRDARQIVEGFQMLPPRR